jgi:hypothetical protein
MTVSDRVVTVTVSASQPERYVTRAELTVIRYTLHAEEVLRRSGRHRGAIRTSDGRVTA